MCTKAEATHVQFQAFKDYELCPNMSFFITADARKSNKQFRPDGGMADHPSRSMHGSGVADVAVNPSTHGQQAHNTGAASGSTNPPAPVQQVEVGRYAPFDWHTHGMVLEMKASSNADPFYTLADAENNGTLEKSDEDSCLTQGQLAQYASELFNHQHRTHAFQLFIAGDYARFLYWDRAGAVVTERFNYVTQPAVLADFMLRYNHMSATRRGWDGSVSEPSKSEVKTFRKVVKKFVEAMKNPKAAQRRIRNAEDTLDENFPPYKMTVGAVKTGEPQDIVIQKPFEVCKSPTGRSTRGYLAYSLTSQRLMFLKDSWRVEVEDLSDEDSIYAKLKEGNVPFIPEVLCAGDVSVDGEVQRTCTEQIARDTEASWKVDSSRSRSHVHHRLLQELAYPLSTSANSEEYVRAFRDAFESECFYDPWSYRVHSD